MRPPPVGARPTRARLLVLALLTVGTLINYLDRTVISIAALPMRDELGLDAAVMGVVFSAFSWTYAAAQIPGGLLLDRIGVRLTYFLSVTLWSAVTLLHGFTTGLTSLLGLRLGLGIAEAPAYPCNSRVLNTWFPQAERARATGVYSVGQYFGLAFLSPVLFWITAEFGWRTLFMIAGSIGILFGLLWWSLYRDPAESPRVNQAELDFIAAGGALTAPATPIPFRWANIGFLLRQRQILGASLGQFASNSTLVFFLTWFPTYLATERHMGWIKVGFFAVMPFIAASIGVLSGGALSDLLLKRTGSANIARKLPIIAGLALASTIVAANFLDDNGLVIAVLSVAFFGQGMCNLGWTLITDVAPRQLVGLTGGLFNLFANVAGIVTPLVIGFIVAATGSFYWALAYVAVIAVLGALCYIFVVGDVRRVEFKSPTSVLVGLIGAGIQRSSTPSLHMDEGRALGIDYRYELMDLDLIANGSGALPGLLDAAQSQGYAGLNITYPCKQSVIPLLDELSADAKSLQSVNTVVFREGRRIGHNTDWWGFAENFRRGMPNAPRDRVVLVGAGGGGAAVGYAALQLGTKQLLIFDVDSRRASTLAARLGELFKGASVRAVDDVVAALHGADGLIHASPTGMAKLPGMPVPPSCLIPSLWVAEIVYVPLETELLRVARGNGCRTLDGGGMAVFQAAMAFELFCGVKPDPERMLGRFNEKLRSD